MITDYTTSFICSKTVLYLIQDLRIIYTITGAVLQIFKKCYLIFMCLRAKNKSKLQVKELY